MDRHDPMAGGGLGVYEGIPADINSGATVKFGLKVVDTKGIFCSALSSHISRSYLNMYSALVILEKGTGSEGAVNSQRISLIALSEYTQVGLGEIASAVLPSLIHV